MQNVIFTKTASKPVKFVAPVNTVGLKHIPFRQLLRDLVGELFQVYRIR